MNLYLISQDENRRGGHYESAVVAAPDEDSARNMHPDEGRFLSLDDWCDAACVSVKYLGEAASGTPPGVVCASYREC